MTGRGDGSRQGFGKFLDRYVFMKGAPKTGSSQGKKDSPAGGSTTAKPQGHSQPGSSVRPK